MMEKMKNMMKGGKGEKKKTLRGSVKPHGCHLLVCTGEEDWKAERLESVEKTFYSRLHKVIKNLNLDKKESIKITARTDKTYEYTESSSVKLCVDREEFFCNISSRRSFRRRSCSPEAYRY